MFPGEISILQWLEQLRSPVWNHFWETVTLLGEDIVFILVIAVIYFLYDKKLAYRISFLAVCSLGINGILKNLFQIPRPFADGRVTCVRAETATGYSFPSGHTQNFTTWSVALADYYKQKKWLFFALFSSFLVGFSRMFLGAHYLSDVIVSLLLGTGISVLGNIIFDKTQNKNTLYLWAFLMLTPFFVWFLWNPDPLFRDFFKCYGMLGGFLLAVRLEGAYGQFKENVTWLRRIVRMVAGVALALLFKALLSSFMPSDFMLGLLWDSVRYSLLVLIIFGGYPILLNQCNL